MSLLYAGVDTAVIALWLGHADIRSTNAYLPKAITRKPVWWRPKVQLERH